jgi:hypothetical protein
MSRYQGEKDVFQRLLQCPFRGLACGKMDSLNKKQEKIKMK